MKKRTCVMVLGLVLALSLGGCWDATPPYFRVVNRTAETIVVVPQGPKGEVEAVKQVAPGTVGLYAPNAPGCESRPWVATTLSGTVLATIPGGCTQHVWTIRGPNDATYE